MAGIIQVEVAWNTHSFDRTRTHGSLEAGAFAMISGYGAAVVPEKK